jgi:hypothetical protein
MSATTPINQQNPLTRFMRQPKIYITMPSQGQYWPPGSIELPENGQVPVFSMTARDELLFKTPDALMNGQAVVDVIQSCVPNIKNAWHTPSIDMDMILVAIRMATYGEKMSIKYQVPVIEEETDYEIDLHQFIDRSSENMWIEQVPIDNELIVFIKPLTYRHMTNISVKSFETSKIMQIAQNDSLSDKQKLDMVNNSFKILSELTTDLMMGTIFKIKTPEGDVTDSRYIKEFIENADKSVFDIVQQHINDLKEQNEIKPVTMATTEDQQARGAPVSFDIPINFDQTNFFA